MTTDQVAIDRDALARVSRKGLVAAALLAVLTVVEFLVAINLDNPLFALIPFVILKGWIILDTFMHVRAVFGEGDH
ncbi:MAG: hypothetical protein BMS9Abin12_2258 [Acidimicrobiia bacterium]|nr:MAG: hypothetical protein BMS9Abin12_2258 [Acidimicrobiia bacterium]